MLVNLLSNAAKFTERGDGAVKAFVERGQADQIEVRDTGVGFPPEEAEAIFDKFQQAKHGDTLVDRPPERGWDWRSRGKSSPGMADGSGRRQNPAGQRILPDPAAGDGSLPATAAVTSRIVALAGAASSSEGAAREFIRRDGKAQLVVTTTLAYAAT